jgi:hypothetical protein
MSRWQRPLGIGTLLVAAIVMALYEFSVLATQPAVTVSILLAIVGASTLARSAPKPPSIPN